MSKDPYKYGTSAERLAFLRGWESQTLGTKFPQEQGTLQYMHDLGKKEAKEMQDNA